MAKGVKTGGRSKGTPNKITTRLLDVLEEEGFNPVVELLKEKRQEDIHANLKRLAKEIKTCEESKEVLKSQIKRKENQLEDLKGSKAKTKVDKAKKLKEQIQELREAHFENEGKLGQAKADFLKNESKLLSTKENIDICLKLMEYIYPKRRAIEGSLDVGAQTVADVISNIINDVDGSTSKVTDK